MQKTSAKIITALLLAALTLTLIPLAFASLGTIIINSTAGVQPLPITPVPAGGNVSLYFGNVTFSGSQFYLLFSADGLSQVSSGDIRYTPLFSVAAVMDLTTAPIVLADPNFPGQWLVGQGWINGSIPTNIAGGLFYIKAFDGATTALAVTHAIPIIASLRIIPAAGAAGTTIIVSGNAFPTNALVNLSYVDPLLNIVRFAPLVQANALGQFNYTMNAPDLKAASGAGDSAPVTGVFTFHAQENATAADYTATYTETERGLIQIGRPRSGSTAGNLQNATGVYGNMSRFDLTPTEGLTTISVGVGQTLRIVGNSFYPGAVTMRWDNSIDVAPTGNTANGIGFFNATFTVPATGVGSHNITLIDSGLQVFVVFVNVVPSITVSPISGPIGTLVTVNGYGFPASTGTTVYNATVTFSGFAPDRNGSLTDANGQFSLTFVVPTGSAGGPHTVTATANQSGFVAVTATFTVTSAFTISPTEFYANSTGAVVATGTGFDPANRYFVAIDNLFSPFSNTTNGIAPSASGGISFTFIQAGFQPGLHVVALYQVGSGASAGGFNVPAANATFTVLGGLNVTTDNTTATMLNAINQTVTQNGATINTVNTTVNTIGNNLLAINATVIAINGNVATLATAIGTMQISLSSINATIFSINGSLVTLNTAIGTVTTTLNGIGANVTSIKGTVATLQTTLGAVQTTVNNINANITSINSGFATVQTSVGTITTTLTSINGKIDSISGTVSSISSAVSGIATISTTVGSIQTSLSSIGTTVTRIDGNVATIVTDLGTLQGTVTSIQGDVATIKTNVGTIQADVSDLQTSVGDVPGQVNVPIWIAVVLALIAAIAAIASLLLVRRKIAG